jgi:hypothetical protein
VNHYISHNTEQSHHIFYFLLFGGGRRDLIGLLLSPMTTGRLSLITSGGSGVSSGSGAISGWLYATSRGAEITSGISSTIKGGCGLSSFLVGDKLPESSSSDDDWTSYHELDACASCRSHFSTSTANDMPTDSRGSMFTSAWNGPTAPLYPLMLGSNTEPNSIIVSRNCSRTLSGNTLSGSNCIVAEWRDVVELRGGRDVACDVES